MFIPYLHFSTILIFYATCTKVSSIDDPNEDYSSISTVSPSSDLDWLEGLNEIGPYLCGLMILIVGMHLFIQPDWMMASLVKQYLNDGTPILGSALDCQEKPNAPGVYWVEVCYDANEHQYIHNPSLRFRHPEAYISKTFVRRFEYGRQVPMGESIPILLPRGHLFPRSGCPREVLDRIATQLYERRFRRYFILGFGFIAIVLVVALCCEKILRAVDDDHQVAAWWALCACLLISEILATLFCGDQFLKKKCRLFDGARPMVSAAEQQVRLDRKAEQERRTVAPFSIPLNEFAGHARATERNR
jgi:hypothetical protein